MTRRKTLGTVADNVRARTTIHDEFQLHASHQAMTAMLDDWRAAHRRLGRQIVVLAAMRDQRRAEKEDGRWPPPVCPCGDHGRNHQ